MSADIHRIDRDPRPDDIARHADHLRALKAVRDESIDRAELIAVLLTLLGGERPAAPEGLPR